MSLPEFTSYEIFRNSLLAWSIALGVIVVAFAALLTARRFVRNRHAAYAKTEQAELLELPLEILSRTTLPFFVIVALAAGLSTLTMGARAARIVNLAITIALFWQAGVWLATAVGAWLERKRRRSIVADRAAVGSLAVIGFILQVLIWTMVALLTLDNLGVDITALVAGLGIGGIAVALAVQNVLGDLLASLSITLDRPFVVGDFLIVDEFLGSVEHIGIKSTRLRSLSGEQIIMSNADLLKSRVRNYGRMHERRVLFSIGVTYETPANLLEKIPQLIREIVEAQQLTRFDRSHFNKYGDFSLNFETVYYVLNADYNPYMDIQQAINLAIYRKFEELGIEFAYPTRKLYLAPITVKREETQEKVES